MEIKTPRQESRLVGLAKKLRQRRVLLAVFGSGCFLLYTLTALGGGYLLRRSGFSVGETLAEVKKDVYLMPKRVQALVSSPPVDRIVIDIKHKHYMRLAYQRERALSSGILTSGSEDFVPATIQHKDRTINVRLRLKGDSPDHLETDKWSFRVRVRGDSTLFGMKRFSIQHPKTRNYLYEWLFHRALKREGLVALRYRFIDVTVNGKHLGTYALEEHFDKRLIENSDFREGPIVRFNEDLLWQELADHGPGRGGKIVTSFLPVDIDTYQTDRVFGDRSLFAQHSEAVRLLESFRRGELPTSKVFDVPKLARFYAVSDLIGAQHSTNWTNMRFYHNPITSKLEPIGFDGDAGKRIWALSSDLSPVVDPLFLETIFNDVTFYEAYVTTLERVSRRAYVDSLFDEVGDELESNLLLLNREFPEFEFSRKVIYDNQSLISKKLQPTAGLNAYFGGVSGGQIHVEVGNIQPLPIELLSLSLKDSLLFWPTTRTIVPERPVTYVDPPLDCRITSRKRVDYQSVTFLTPEILHWTDQTISDLKVRYRLLGTERTLESPVHPWSVLGGRSGAGQLFSMESNLDDFEFLIKRDSESRVDVLPGTWNVDSTIVIPKGYRLKVGEGTRLNLSRSAIILSYSPLEFVGTEEQPIVIHSTDSTGQGIVVIGAQDVSVLTHVHFGNLSSPVRGGWTLTGAVTFYESPVMMNSTRFVGNRSEDALNIIRSEFSIDEAQFSQSHSDAVDIDFGKGRITSSLFLGSTNDAIDVSGSTVEIENVTIDGAGDKGISVGERSELLATGLKISNANIAVASKDESTTTVSDIAVARSRTGFTAYQKKSEFGPGALHLYDLETREVTLPFLVEIGSTITVDGTEKTGKKQNVYEMLYGSEPQ